MCAVQCSALRCVALLDTGATQASAAGEAEATAELGLSVTPGNSPNPAENQEKKNFMTELK